MTRTIHQLFDLKGKTALITGGSRGLGLQMAHALGEAGARVVISSRKAADLEEATAELQAAGIDARWIAADCSREEDIQRLADESLQRLGDIDILINNAGAAWGAHGIRVNAICPGFFPSKMTMGTLKAMGEERLAAHAPLGRLGDDEDLKGLTLLYASDAGKHITGQWLAVDGGVSAIIGG